MERGFRRHEQNDEVERARLQHVLVALAGEAADVGAHSAGVRRQGAGARGVVVGADPRDVRGDRHLRVDHHRLAVGQVDDDIWAQARAVVGGVAALDDVFAAFGQTNALQQILQDHLAPVTLDLGFAGQRPAEGLGLVTELGLRLAQAFEQVEQRGAVAVLGVVGAGDGVFELLEPVAQRIQHAFKPELLLGGEDAALLLEQAVGEMFELAAQCVARLAGVAT